MTLIIASDGVWDVLSTEEVCSPERCLLITLLAIGAVAG